MGRMRVLVASDSFKGCASSARVGELVRAGALRAAPDADVRVVAIADGGEGTVDALLGALGGTLHQVEVEGPLGALVTAAYGLAGDELAVLETASAAGLSLTGRTDADARGASTYGVGQLVRDALDHGARRILVGLGGSATSDGGAGMAEALGARILDASGAPVPRGLGGLASAAAIDVSRLDPRLADVEVTALTDVTNPLCGPTGAVAVYGPQKGLDPARLAEYDGWMAGYARLLAGTLGEDVAALPGAGAAGGLGAGLVAFCGARVRPGIEAVLDAIGFDRMLEGVDLVITGEGRMDAQSAFGKAPVGVARRARRRGVPVVAVVGGRDVDLGSVYDEGVDLVLPCPTEPMALEESVRRAEELLPVAGESAVRALLLGRARGGA